MARRRRCQTIQNQDEYRGEPQCQPTPPQTRSRMQFDYAPSSLSPAHINPHAAETSDSESYSSVDHEEGDEVIIEDEIGERTCVKAKLADLWNLPPGHRVVVVCNARGQPVGNEGRLLAQFLGSVARDGRICTLSYNDWRYVKKEAEEKILTAVKAKFLYPVRCEKWILKSTGKKWKDYKCDLKGTHFDERASLKELYSKAPEDVVNDQWISLVNFWKSDAGKARSLRNKRNRAMLKTTHTAGTKSFARVAEEMRQKHPEKKEPQRAEVYLSTHKHKDGTYMDERLASDLQKKMAENLEASTLQGRVAWKGDAFSEIIGKDKQGYIRGVGLGPSPREIFKPSCSCSCEGAVVKESIRQIKEHVERLEQQVQNQSQTTAELKCRVQCLESLSIQVPDHLCCKITLDIFRDPVITPSGVTYERAVLHEHLQKVGKFDPITREPLEPHQLVPNLAIKEAVRAFLDEHGWSYKMKR